MKKAAVLSILIGVAVLDSCQCTDGCASVSGRAFALRFSSIKAHNHHSLNPARSFASAFQGRYWHALGSISWPQLWTCWLLQNPFCGCAAVSARTAPNSITLKTSAVFSATARSRFDHKETNRRQPPQPPGNWPSDRSNLACSGLK